MFRKYMPSAVESLHASKYRDEKIEKSGEEFAKGTIEYFGKYLENKTKISDEILSKVVNLELVVGLPEEISSDAKVETFYQELQLNGDEEIVESYFEMCKFHRKLENELTNEWRWKLEEISVQEDMKYFATDNILCENVSTLASTSFTFSL